MGTIWEPDPVVEVLREVLLVALGVVSAAAVTVSAVLVAVMARSRL